MVSELQRKDPTFINIHLSTKYVDLMFEIFRMTKMLFL